MAMNLKKMYDAQKVLMDRIEKEHPTQPGENRFDKKVLALLVEVGECANEQRSWKYWSNNQEPRGYANCSTCDGKGSHISIAKGYSKCETCNGTGLGIKNPLLEEYVDGLHFILELGIELGYHKRGFTFSLDFQTSIEEQFINIFYYASNMNFVNHHDCYIHIVEHYLALGEMLGFTWEQMNSYHHSLFRFLLFLGN